MTRNKYIAKLVREYADEWIRDPTWKMKKDDFQARSAEKWAVDEAIKRIETYDGSPTEALVEMSRTLASSTTDWMVIVARDVVEDIYYYVCEID